MDASQHRSPTSLTGARQGKKLLVIGCEVFFREICHLTAVSRNMLDHVWLNQGLHDLGAEKMSARIQAAIDSVPADAYDAILLAFALCNNGVLGVTARDTPLVVPKAHDCITLFLGSRRRYREYFDANPGTYYLTSGWIERDEHTVDPSQGSTIQDQLGLGMSMAQLVEQYGEENAAYIAETLGDMTQHYTRLAYIDMGFEESLDFRTVAEDAARERGWEFEPLEGDLSLLRRLLDGEWNDDFVVVAPGASLAAGYGDETLCCRSGGACPSTER